MATNDPMLTGLFRDRDSAERAYQSISDRGYSREDVNVVMSDETRKRHFSGSTAGRETELGTKAAEGAGIGGAIGGSLGAIAAAIAAVGTTIALPGLGLVIAGWTEALQLMKEGAKYQLFIPPNLAYADRGPLANRLLIFDVELIKVDAGQAAAPAK